MSSERARPVPAALLGDVFVSLRFADTVVRDKHEDKDAPISSYATPNFADLGEWGCKSTILPPSPLSANLRLEAFARSTCFEHASK